MINKLFLNQAIYQQCFLAYKGLYGFSLADKLQKKQMANQKSEFRKELEYMGSKPSFTLLDFRQRAVDGLHKLKKGFKYQITPGTEETEQQLVQQKTILNAMFDEELMNPDLLDGERKKEIAMVAQVELQQVNMVMKQFEHMKGIHSWVKEMKSRGEAMPDNQEDLFYRYRRDKPVKKSFIRFEMKRPHFSKKQRMQKIKWGPRKEV